MLAGFEAKRSIWSKKLKMWRRRRCAIVTSHHRAILDLAQIGDAHDQPDSNGHQSHREGNGREVGQDAVSKFVGLFPGLLVA